MKLLNFDNLLRILYILSASFFILKSINLKPAPPPPPAIAQNQGVQVSCAEIETTKPDGTKTRELKFSAIANQKQEITPPAPPLFTPITFRVSFIPNWNFETNAINYGFLAEKRITGELFAGIYTNLSKFYQIQNVGGSLSYGF